MVAIVTALREPYGPSPYPPPVRSIDTTQSELFQNQPVTILVPLDNAAVNPLEVIVLQPDGTVYVTTSVYPATVFGSRVAVYSFTPAEFGWWQIQTYPGGAEQNNYFFYVYAPPLKDSEGDRADASVPDNRGDPAVHHVWGQSADYDLG